jgi:hypothetical protein
MHAAASYLPTSDVMDPGLNLLDSLFAQFSVSELPSESHWIEHLDVLGALRMVPFGGVRSYEEALGGSLDGWLAPGLEMGSEAMTQAATEFASLGVAVPLVEHELKPGFARVGYCSTQQMALRVKGWDADLSAQVTALARSKWGLGSADASLFPSFAAKIDERPHLQEVRAWWNSITTPITITPVGRLLARANADRLDTAKLLPPLD